MATPAKKRDYRAQIQAIMLWFGEKEGLTYKDGRPKAVGYERFAELTGVALQTVKKWFQKDYQTPERESIIALNKIAPPHLKIPMGEEQTPAQLPQANGDGEPGPKTVEQAILEWLNSTDRQTITRADLARIQDALDILQGKHRP